MCEESIGVQPWLVSESTPLSMGLCVWPWGSPLLSCLRAKTPLYRSCNGLLWRVEHLERLSHYARRSSTIRNWLSGRPRPLLHLVSHNACFFISSWNLHPLFYYLPLYFKSPFLKSMVFLFSCFLPPLFNNYKVLLWLVTSLLYSLALQVFLSV